VIVLLHRAISNDRLLKVLKLKGNPVDNNDSWCFTIRATRVVASGISLDVVLLKIKR
jgi:hypothetical protein